MTDKCQSLGAEIQFCNDMNHVLENGFGDFATQVRTRLSDSAARIVVTAGRFKKNKVIIAFCPACGGDIQTKFKEPSND